jgi:phosphoglycolate phosphatase
MSEYKIILFDLDGTVTNPKIGITKSVAYALKYFGIETKNLDELCCFIGPPLKDSFVNIMGFSSEKADMAVKKYREYYSKEGIYENEIYNGMKDLLYNLKNENKEIILATSKPIVFAKKILKFFEIENLFTFVSGSELNGERSIKSEVIDYAVKNNGLSNHLSKIIMVGDREYDIKGAKDIGIDSMGVLFGFGSKDELEKAGADFIVNSVDEIEKVLLNK